MLGDGALEAVQGLVDQSLLSVRETAAGRPLPDARDRPRVRPPAAGRRRRGRRGARRRAAPLGDRATPAHGARLPAASSSRRSTRSRAEEVNLADELRDAIADGDRGALVELLAALGCSGRSAASTPGWSR